VVAAIRHPEPGPRVETPAAWGVRKLAVFHADCPHDLMNLPYGVNLLLRWSRRDWTPSAMRPDGGNALGVVAIGT